MIDTHAHIDDEQYPPEELEAFIAAQKQGGVEAVLVPAVNAASLRAVAAVADRFPTYCFPALGLHPEEVRADWRAELESIRQAYYTRRWVAVGEIGLDYHWDITYKEEQRLALRMQLEWALEWNLPVMLHSRDATEDMLVLLRDYCRQGLRGVMHCFSGSRETAARIVEMGLFLGIGGVLTFKNAHLGDTLRSVPLEHILLETDSPYMAPVPNRGKRNEPRWMCYVVSRLAEIYGTDEAEIDRITTANARRLFRI